MHKLKLIKVLTLGIVLAFGKVAAQDLPNSQYFDSNGVRIHYIEQGTGEAVILLHGNTGSTGSWLKSGVFQNLAKDYRVVAFDARAHGKSDKPHDVSAYGPEMSHDIIRLLDHLGIAKAHMIGYSMGTRIMGHLIPSHSDRFLTATFGGFAPSWNWSSENQKMIERRSKNLLNNPKQKLLDAGQDTQALAALVMGFPELVVTKEDLSNFQIPTIAISGSEDGLLPRTIELKEIMPKMRIVLIDGATHGTALRRAEFIEAARAFIAEHGSSDYSQ